MKKVLIVDDNDRYADNLKAYYSKLGYSCTRAYNAQEGWDLYSKSKTKSNGISDFDTIVTDITMETQTSGLWMIRKIHKDEFKGIKIILDNYQEPNTLKICYKTNLINVI